MKGIILAAGAGTRLSPATLPVSKTLLPIYDRPMIYYPLSTLMSAGIRDILIITSEADQPNFKRALGDGSQFGIKIQYDIQYKLRGISDAFIIGKDYIAGERVALALADNIFYGDKMDELLSHSEEWKGGATVFGYRVPDPQRFGVATFDEDGKVTSLEEKPKDPKSDWAVVGLYFFDGDVCEYASQLKPSARGELEITDLNQMYLDKGKLNLKRIDESVKWIDAGTFDSFLDSSIIIKEEEKKIDDKILCPELIALRKGFITKEQLFAWLDKHKDNEYYHKIGELAQ